VAKEEFVNLDQGRRKGQLDRDVSRQHRDTGLRILAFEADGHQWIGRQSRARERLVVGVEKIAQGSLVAIPQSERLGRDAEGEEREGKLVDQVDR